jgi:hypothetical protein
VNLYFLTTKKTSHKKYMKYYHIAAWSWCIILTIVPIPFQKYGPAGLWCWIIEADRSAWQVCNVFSFYPRSPPSHPSLHLSSFFRSCSFYSSCSFSKGEDSLPLLHTLHLTSSVSILISLKSSLCSSLFNVFSFLL